MKENDWSGYFRHRAEMFREAAKAANAVWPWDRKRHFANARAESTAAIACLSFDYRVDGREKAHG